MTWIWSTARKFLDPETASKAVIVSGEAADESDMPDDMIEYLTAESMKVMEKRRRSTFVGPSSKQKDLTKGEPVAL